MSEFLALGIDCGGTHTDAALLLADEKSRSARLLAGAKTLTIHEDLPQSIKAVMTEMGALEGGSDWISKVRRVTLGATLEVNALAQNKADQVGLALSAGPGLDPRHFIIGDHYCIAKGGLDHRGVQTAPLDLRELEQKAAAWPEEGVKAIACVGKFSPRNPAHEKAMAEVAGKFSGLPVCMGHSLSGKLNFPRRVATAYYNAAVMRLHDNFLNAVEDSFAALGLTAQARLLKADGGAAPFQLSRAEPVHSILSGPAASVMGMLALGNGGKECVLLLDVGGTTSDLAVLFHNSPVTDRDGMKMKGRRTLVKSLASISIGIGGDSLVRFDAKSRKIVVGPERFGAAMAFGGASPTLLDALNVLDETGIEGNRGNGMWSLEGMRNFTTGIGRSPDEIMLAAREAVDYALEQIALAARELLENINSRPIYTLAGLRNVREARPLAVCLAGGPAQCLAPRLERILRLPVEVCRYHDIANAIGAALTIPTASLEIYVDGAKQTLTAPGLDYAEKVSARFDLEDAKNRACQLLREQLALAGVHDMDVEVVEADMFAVLDDYGRGARDIRVSCQARPGICAYVL